MTTWLVSAEKRTDDGGVVAAGVDRIEAPSEIAARAVFRKKNGDGWVTTGVERTDG